MFTLHLFNKQKTFHNKTFFTNRHQRKNRACIKKKTSERDLIYRSLPISRIIDTLQG